jgi:hypothetical protein
VVSVEEIPRRSITCIVVLTVQSVPGDADSGSGLPTVQRRLPDGADVPTAARANGLVQRDVVARSRLICLSTMGA